MPRNTIPFTVCGLSKCSRPASRSGFTATMTAPCCFAFSSEVSIRGWFVPGFCPAIRMRPAVSMSTSVTEPLPMPMVSPSAAPLDSWHMFEQSGRLFVPSARANSW